MKITIPLLIVCVCVIGCSRFGSGSTQSQNSTANAANTAGAPAIKKVIDLPATIGKTKEEIKAIVPGTPTSENPWLEYDLPEASLTFKFDKQKKVSDATLRFQSIQFGDASISGTDTAEQIATMAGVDIKGKTPSAAVPDVADTYDQQINGKTMSVVFYHTGGKFKSVNIEPKP